jgi:hypothetical protein
MQNDYFGGMAVEMVCEFSDFPDKYEKVTRIAR